jgi:hypothetical protein
MSVLREIGYATPESYSPPSHLKKFDLEKGDGSLTVGPWLAANPHATIFMAIFDMDLYKPTRDVFESKELPVDDPRQRQPDISYAKSALNW